MLAAISAGRSMPSVEDWPRGMSPRRKARSIADRDREPARRHGRVPQRHGARGVGGGSDGNAVASGGDENPVRSNQGTCIGVMRRCSMVLTGKQTAAYVKAASKLQSKRATELDWSFKLLAHTAMRPGLERWDGWPRSPSRVIAHGGRRRSASDSTRFEYQPRRLP
jgi:hypothetical protein